MPEEQTSEVAVNGMGEGKIVHHPPLKAPEGWITPNDDSIDKMLLRAGKSMASSKLEGTKGMSHEAEGVEIPK